MSNQTNPSPKDPTKSTIELVWDRILFWAKLPFVIFGRAVVWGTLSAYFITIFILDYFEWYDTDWLFCAGVVVSALLNAVEAKERKAGIDLILLAQERYLSGPQETPQELAQKRAQRRAEQQAHKIAERQRREAYQETKKQKELQKQQQEEQKQEPPINS